MTILFGWYNPVILQNPSHSILCRLLLAFILTATIGCASGGHEPNAIVLRNGTPNVLDVIGVHEVTSSPLDARRFGHFTSVPPGSNQYIARRKNPPPLPGDAVIVWQTRGGPELQQPINLNSIVRQSNIPDGILVIEVLPNNTAHAFITARPD